VNWLGLKPNSTSHTPTGLQERCICDFTKGTALQKTSIAKWAGFIETTQIPTTWCREIPTH